MRFIETPVFTALLRRTLDDASYRALQLALLLRPEQGAIIAGSGGLRKLRVALPPPGKRGGLRVIYYWDAVSGTLYLLYLYKKSEHGDLTPSQVKQLRHVVEEEFG